MIVARTHIIFVFVFSYFVLHGQHDNVSGVYPHLTMTANHMPRTEAGIGALMPWADRLWAITYVAHLEQVVAQVFTPLRTTWSLSNIRKVW